MIGMHYSVTLPADYDMEIIARRIRDKGHLMNGFEGLGFKAFLMARRRAGTYSSPTNLYAPFYIWRRAEGMAEFVSGPGFAALSGDFGRPPVTTWTIWEAKIGSDLPGARFAQRQIISIPPEVDLHALRGAEGRRAEEAMAAGAVAFVSAFDPGGWTFLSFSFWRHPIDASTGEGQIYEVGHVATGA
ncbi:protein of unknown function [Ensifer adhaerens]|nr:protein of unknown function [Ensifer adhaerens]